MKNKSSIQTALKTITEMEKLLIASGATNISKTASDGKVTGFYFELMVNSRPMVFKVPVDPIGAQRIFEKKIKRPRKTTLNRIVEQAERTAWKCWYDLIAAQLAIIEMNQAMAVQVFLPWAFDGERTLFEKLQDGGFKQLNAPQGAKDGADV